MRKRSSGVLMVTCFLIFITACTLTDGPGDVIPMPTQPSDRATSLPPSETITSGGDWHYVDANAQYTLTN